MNVCEGCKPVVCHLQGVESLQSAQSVHGSDAVVADIELIQVAQCIQVAELTQHVLLQIERPQLCEAVEVLDL